MDWLDSHKEANIIITTHHKPDGDALGSSLGLHNFFKEQGYNSTVISPTDYPSFLNWMPGETEVINFEKQENKALEILKNGHIIFCLDFNDLKRINELGKHVAELPLIKVLIDHHQEPEGFDDFRLWTTKAGSTAQLVFEFISEWKGKDKISQKSADCLYAGIMTDTGSFRFDSVTAETHRITADLIELGARNALIHQLIYDQFTHDRLRFIGFCLYEKLHIIKQYNTALMYISKEELAKFNIQTGDTEGLVNYGLSIEGIELSALIIDRTKLVKMSFRGKGKFPCNKFAKEYFEGGGHFSAAGGQSTDTLENTVNKFRSSLENYKEYLK